MLSCCLGNFGQTARHLLHRLSIFFFSAAALFTSYPYYSQIDLNTLTKSQLQLFHFSTNWLSNIRTNTWMSVYTTIHLIFSAAIFQNQMLKSWNWHAVPEISPNI